MAACLYDIAFIICFPLTQLYDHVQSVEVVLYNTGKVGLDFCALGVTDSQELAPGYPTISPTMVTEHGATPFPLTFSPSPPPPHLLPLTPSLVPPPLHLLTHSLVPPPLHLLPLTSSLLFSSLLTSSQGHLPALENQKLTIHYLPGVPAEFKKILQVHAHNV